MGCRVSTSSRWSLLKARWFFATRSRAARSEVVGRQGGGADQAHVPAAPDEVREGERDDVVQGAREVADRPVVTDGFMEARHIEVVE
jgi:hypothetical protein